jgi:hypothetical protein
VQKPSNLDFLDEFLHGCPMSPPDEYRDVTSNLVMTSSFQILSNFLFSNISTFRICIWSGSRVLEVVLQHSY